MLCMAVGCSRDVPPAGETVRAHFDGLAAAEMQVKILSDFGESALEYQVDYEYNKEDNDLLTVTAPAGIAGVQVEISGAHADAFTLRYAGAALQFDADAVPGMTPADAIAGLMYDLRAGEPAKVGTEDVEGVKAVTLHYETADRQPALEKTVWIDPENKLPVQYEMDMTQVMQNLMDNMLEMVSQEVEEVGDVLLEIQKVTISMNMSDFNLVESITIPQEAREAASV